MREMREVRRFGGEVFRFSNQNRTPGSGFGALCVVYRSHMIWQRKVLPAGVMCPRVCVCLFAFSTVLFTLQHTTLPDNAASAKRVCVLVTLIAVLQSKVTANVRSIVDKTRERKHTTGGEEGKGQKINYKIYVMRTPGSDMVCILIERARALVTTSAMSVSFRLIRIIYAHTRTHTLTRK